LFEAPSLNQMFNPVLFSVKHLMSHFVGSSVDMRCGEAIVGVGPVVILVCLVRLATEGPGLPLEA
jgi:hypothetical protein